MSDVYKDFSPLVLKPKGLTILIETQLMSYTQHSYVMGSIDIQKGFHFFLMRYAISTTL